MRPWGIIFASIVIVCAAAAAGAQTPERPMTALESALACAAPPEVETAGSDALRIIGAQTPDARILFSARDVLVIGGGTAAGVQLGQHFLIRRPIQFGAVYATHPDLTASVGSLRILSVNETTALATADRVCDAIMRGDYLVPFAPPQVPAGADSAPAAAGELDFDNPARMIAVSGNRRIAAAGDFVVIDSGADKGVAPGARFAIYRDLRVEALPLSAIGEAVVMTSGPVSSVVRITLTRDAVQPGDYLVPRR